MTDSELTRMRSGSVPGIYHPSVAGYTKNGKARRTRKNLEERAWEKERKEGRKDLSWVEYCRAWLFSSSFIFLASTGAKARQSLYARPFTILYHTLHALLSQKGQFSTRLLTGFHLHCWPQVRSLASLVSAMYKSVGLLIVFLISFLTFNLKK